MTGPPVPPETVRTALVPRVAPVAVPMPARSIVSPGAKPEIAPVKLVGLLMISAPLEPAKVKRW